MNDCILRAYAQVISEDKKDSEETVDSILAKLTSQHPRKREDIEAMLFLLCTYGFADKELEFLQLLNKCFISSDCNINEFKSLLDILSFSDIEKLSFKDFTSFLSMKKLLLQPPYKDFSWPDPDNLKDLSLRYDIEILKKVVNSEYLLNHQCKVDICRAYASIKNMGDSYYERIYEISDTYDDKGNASVKMGLIDSNSLPHSILVKLASHPSVEVRKDLAHTYPKLPEDVIKKLSEDDDQMVKRILMANYDIHPSNEIFEKLLSENDGVVISNIILRNDLPDSISIRYISDPKWLKCIVYRKWISEDLRVEIAKQAPAEFVDLMLRWNELTDRVRVAIQQNPDKEKIQKLLAKRGLN